MHKRLNRITRIVVMVAGTAIIGGSAVGGIALAANRSDDSPASVSPHATPTRSADDNNNNRGHGSTSDGRNDATPTPTATCTEDRRDDDVIGDRHGDPNAPDDDAVNSDHRGGRDDGGHHDGLDDCDD